MKTILIVLSLLCSVASLHAQYCSNSNRFTEVDVFSLGQIDSALNVPYGMANASNGTPTTLAMDIYYPDLAVDSLSERPFVMILHGGGWAVGDKSQMRDDCREFAKKGYVAATMSYRLGIPPSLDVQYMTHQDAHAAFRFIVANATTYGIDTDWMFVGGRSSGSITSMFLVYNDEQDWEMINPGVVGRLGNISASGNSLTNNFALKGLINYWGSVQPSAVTAAEMLPTIHFHGEQDPVVALDSSGFTGMVGSRAIHNFLVAEGICSDLNIDPNGGHGVYDNPEGVKFRTQKASCFIRSVFCNDCASVSTTDSIPAACAISTVPTSLGLLSVINNVSVYPNPFNQQITIQGLSGGETIILRNAIGQEVYQGSNVSSISTASYPEGIYFLEIFKDANREVVKLIKQ